MRYLSTRGEAAQLGFDDVLLAGLATDGGLYTPLAYPHVAASDIAALAGQPYSRAAAQLIAPYLSETFSPEVLRAQTESAYAGFRHSAIAPLTQIDDNLFVLELFHGPTLAFKDVALQLLGKLFDHVLTARGERITIIGATSGDTGSTAIDE